MRTDMLPALELHVRVDVATLHVSSDHLRNATIALRQIFRSQHSREYCTGRTSSEPSSGIPARFTSSRSQRSTNLTLGCHQLVVSGPNASASSNKKLNCVDGGGSSIHRESHTKYT